MDTTEELNGTYFYAGRTNLTAAGLFLMIYCESIADHFVLTMWQELLRYTVVLIIKRLERNPQELRKERPEPRKP